MSDHDWSDDALRPTLSGGAGWMAGQRYTCTVCGTERRKAMTGKEGSGDNVSIYFVNGTRVEKAPECRAS